MAKTTKAYSVYAEGHFLENHPLHLVMGPEDGMVNHQLYNLDICPVPGAASCWRSVGKGVYDTDPFSKLWGDFVHTEPYGKE